ncbi:MAG: tRNA (5-methylaminomethyl-2-thiouridine)(34)-methyltransferase MnmD [Rhodobacteraceae bacterium]|nr:tRNA (5-methylaminomethyl-2-thiouridine)(34)-methyltransferase MnmD [Paracoccaceae bacterium]
MVPVSHRFGDPYFSVVNGLEETRHVFLAGNDLPARFRDGFHIAELGFGTGLNLLATWESWLTSGQAGTLYFTSFEAFPMAEPDTARALAAFPGLAPLAADLLAALATGATRFDLGAIRVEIIEGDARQTLPGWPGRADAWYLDGFAPAKNPEMWSPGLMQAVAAHTAPGGTLATYSAAGHVRRSLAEAGFAIDRVAGFGRKRHMTTGVLKATT